MTFILGLLVDLLLHVVPDSVLILAVWCQEPGLLMVTFLKLLIEPDQLRNTL